MSQDRLQEEPLLYPLKLGRRNQCCLIDLLSILEGRYQKWGSDNCCDKIEATLEHVYKHVSESHSAPVYWTGGNDDEKGG